MAFDIGPGTYVLVIDLIGPVCLTVGRLGTFDFQAGTYLYVGSAMAGLKQRIQRHLIGGKLHWHLDYLLRVAQVAEVWTIPSAQRMECDVARLFTELLSIPVSGFGASDCRCLAHLFYLDNSLTCQPVLNGLYSVYPVYRWQTTEV